HRRCGRRRAPAGDGRLAHDAAGHRRAGTDRTPAGRGLAALDRADARRRAGGDDGDRRRAQRRADGGPDPRRVRRGARRPPGGGPGAPRGVRTGPGRGARPGPGRRGPKGVSAARPVVRTALVLGGTSDIAAAVLRRLVPEGLEQVVLAVRDPSAAVGDLPLAPGSVTV